MKPAASPATFHSRLMGQLRALIQNGQYKPGSRFLTEREIASRFDTSRPTANKVLMSMVSEGLLEVRKGVGTFVREKVMDYDLKQLVSFTQKVLEIGQEPRTEVLEFQRIQPADAPVHVCHALQCHAKTRLLYVERCRLADGVPVIYERRYVVGNHCPGVRRQDFAGSLYALWSGRFGLTLTGAEESIRAVNASAEEAALLQIKKGAACLQVVATGFIKGEQPLWWEETLYRADVYEFRNRVGGTQNSSPAIGRLRK